MAISYQSVPMDNVKPEAVSPHFHEILGEDVQLTDEAGTRVGHNFFIDEAGQVEEEQKTSGERLFLGSGRSLASAGPGGAVLGYVLMGTVISSVVSCLGEMTALMPVNAPIMEFPRRFLDRGIGFAVGWIYWYS
ncbi:hypothetical protein RJZ90_004561 [Blastomyces dermatitidis]